MAGDNERFLDRWDRRKRAARAAEAEAAAPGSAPEDPRPEAAAAPPADQTARAPGEADPAALPPIESLGATSDYTVFLREGVPAALRAAALRRAWASDPVIAGHRPLVEYAWDFNAPDHGALRATDDVARLARAILRRDRDDGGPAEPEAAEDAAPGPVASGPDAPEPERVVAEETEAAARTPDGDA